MECIAQREFGESFGKAHDEVFVWIVQFEKDIDASIRHHPVIKLLGKCMGCFELPVTINVVLKTQGW